MIVKSSAPLKVGILGGGTDIEPFASQFGGVCVNFTITLRQTITLSTGKDVPPNQENIFPKHAYPPYITSLLATYPLETPLHIHSSADGHLGSGLGSSAAAGVACLAAMNSLKGMKNIPAELAEGAWQAEHAMGWYGGRQDQYASAFGGWNVMEFGSGVRVTPLARGFVEPLKDAIVLFYTGERSVQHPQDKMKEPTKKQIYALQQMKELAIGSIDYIVKADAQKLGGCLDLAWKQKKDSNPQVTTPAIDAVYAHALAAGAFGGKVCGAGSGGYMFFVIDPTQRRQFLNKMKRTGMTEVDFSFDWQGVESRII